MLIDIYSKSNTYSRAALMAAAALIALAASYNWIISPHIENLEAAQRYANGVDSIAKKSETLGAKLKIKQLEVDKLSKQIAQTRDRIFTPGAAQQFLGSLEILAKESNCTITSLNQLGSETDPDVKNICNAAGITVHRASVGLAGDYPDIVKFLRAMYERPSKIMISPFSVSVRRDDSEKLECSLIMTIYVMRDTNIKGVDPNE